MTSVLTGFGARPTSDAGALRVLLLVTRNQRRGAEIFAGTLAGELARRGLSTRVVALAQSTEASALPVPVLGAKPLALRTLWRLRREISAADLVVACGSRTLPASVLASVGRDVPIIYQNIGDPLFWAGTRARRTRVRLLLRGTAGVAALTERSAQIIATRFAVPRQRIRVICNARDSRTFRPMLADERAALRQQIGLPTDGPVVAAVGALGPEKRLDVAISTIARYGRGAVLVVAGDGPLREELQRQATSDAPNQIRFVGQPDDLPGLLRAADALLLTSDSEGVPGALIEAGLSGLPVVATDVGYVRDVVVDGRTGYVVPPGDAGAAAHALGQVLAERKRLGAHAREHCLRHFDLQRVVDDWFELIHDTVIRAGGRQ